MITKLVKQERECPDDTNTHSSNIFSLNSIVLTMCMDSILAAIPYYLLNELFLPISPWHLKGSGVESNSAASSLRSLELGTTHNYVVTKPLSISSFWIFLEKPPPLCLPDLTDVFSLDSFHFSYESSSSSSSSNPIESSYEAKKLLPSLQDLFFFTTC